MAHAPQTVLTPNPPRALHAAAAMALALATVAAWFWSADAGRALGFAWVGVALIAASWRRPVVMFWALWAAALFNYGVAVRGAIVKPTELVQLAMAAMILMRLVAGDRDALGRLIRARWLVAALALLGAAAIVTAARHPNFFNVRYEILNDATILFGVLFFRARDWPSLVALFGVAIGAEAVAALVLRFGFGVTGLDFLGGQGGVLARTMTSADISELAGGRFRLAGTMSHKNMLAAFFALMLPLVGVELLRKKNPAWLIVLLPALAAFALTDSMAGVIALLIAGALLVLFVRRFDDFAVLMLIILPVLAIAVYRYGEPVFYRAQQLLDSTKAGWGSVSARFEILGISQRLIADHPWLGIGRGNFQLYGHTYYTHAHNLFLMKIIEMGIPAGAAFIAVMLAMLCLIWRALARDARRLAEQGQYYYLLGAALGLTAVLAMNMLDYNWPHFSLGPMFAGILGVVMAATTHE
ncbi:MAG: O-antigen ligase family protein [Candidatus Sumerlaeia bacterium]